MVAGCSDNSSRTFPTSPRALAECQLGCVDTDPAPGAPGIFLGTDITMDYCTAGVGTDADGDGLLDYCEKLISLNFRPERKYSRYHDDIRGEPYWVARVDLYGRIVVGYLFSYYRDLGSVEYGCASPINPEWPDSGCHNGDSESIWLTVQYNPDTQHWVLFGAGYSVHGGWNLAQYNATKGYANVEYPAHAGGYPRTWVAEQKHANYFHKADCDAGGFFGSDDCDEDDTAAQVPWSNYWNIGSEAHPFINQVTSRDPSYEYYGGERTECYWTEKRFRGWVPDSIGGGDSDSYLSWLKLWGFASTGVSGCQ